MTKKFKKDFFLLNFNDSALKIMNMVRAFAYRKKIFFKIKKHYFFVYKCEVVNCKQSVPKKIYKFDKNNFIIGTKNNCIKIILIQRPGKKIINNRDFYNGIKFFKEGNFIE